MSVKTVRRVAVLKSMRKTHSLEDAAKALGVSLSTVKNLASRYKIRFAKPSIAKQIRELIDKGYTNKQIIDEIGCERGYPCRIRYLDKLKQSHRETEELL